MLLLRRLVNLHSLWTASLARPNVARGLTRKPSRPTRFRPQFEALEDRCLPSGSPTLIGFDNLPDYAVVTNQYADQGVTFSGASVLTAGVSLNPVFPPHSGRNVLYDDPSLTAGGQGVIAAWASSGGDWSLVGAYVTANAPITISAFDKYGGFLGEQTSGGANYVGAFAGHAPNELLGFSGPNIYRVVFHGAGNSFTIDDFFFGRGGPDTGPVVPITRPGRSSIDVGIALLLPPIGGDRQPNRNGQPVEDFGTDFHFKGSDLPQAVRDANALGDYHSGNGGGYGGGSGGEPLGDGPLDGGTFSDLADPGMSWNGWPNNPPVIVASTLPNDRPPTDVVAIDRTANEAGYHSAVAVLGTAGQPVKSWWEPAVDLRDASATFDSDSLSAGEAMPMIPASFTSARMTDPETATGAGDLDTLFWADHDPWNVGPVLDAYVSNVIDAESGFEDV